ncbi:uncharacterized protein [Dermacentor albipictus]|uniref:uncharacterized protein n=1 Tax=Dermacentor albipictus TaxID=60249 RepID=UPI0038FBF845
MLPATAYHIALTLAAAYATPGDGTNGIIAVSVDEGYCVLHTTASKNEVVRIKDKEIFGGIDPCMSFVCLAEKQVVVAEGCVPVETRGAQCKTEPGREAPFPACCPIPLCSPEPTTLEPATEGAWED